jgi:hypothetical protein
MFLEKHEPYDFGCTLCMADSDFMYSNFINYLEISGKHVSHILTVSTRGSGIA